jgi:cell division protein FtsA
MPKTSSVIVGLDVGTSKVSVCVGQFQEDILNVVGVGTAPNSGLRKGVVSDLEETVSAISTALDEAERMSGIPISSAYVSINGIHISSNLSKGVIAVSRADGEISEADEERALEAARAVALPPNREIIHVLPKNYVIDGQEGVKDPIGMSGIRLEVETLVIGGSTSAIKNLGKCVYQAGLGMDGLVFAPLATAKALLSKRQKESGVILIDMGAGTTTYAIFEEGEVVRTNVLPVGSSHLTNDIAIGLRINLDLAEKIKLRYGSANPESIRESEKIDLTEIDENETQRIPRRDVSHIIEARLNEIFDMIKQDLKAIDREGMLPAGVVLTGGGSKLDGLVDYTKNYLKLPVQIGSPLLEISGLIDKLDDPSYATCIGLMIWGIFDTGSQSAPSGPDLAQLNGVVDKAKGWLKNFMP